MHSWLFCSVMWQKHLSNIGWMVKQSSKEITVCCGILPKYPPKYPHKCCNTFYCQCTSWIEYNLRIYWTFQSRSSTWQYESCLVTNKNIKSVSFSKQYIHCPANIITSNTSDAFLWRLVLKIPTKQRCIAPYLLRAQCSQKGIVGKEK